MRTHPSLLQLKGVPASHSECTSPKPASGLHVRASAATMEQPTRKESPDKVSAGPVEAKDVSFFALYALDSA